MKKGRNLKRLFEEGDRMFPGSLLATISICLETYATIVLRLRPELKDLLFQKAEERGISASELVAQLIETLSD